MLHRASCRPKARDPSALASATTATWLSVLDGHLDHALPSLPELQLRDAFSTARNHHRLRAARGSEDNAGAGTGVEPHPP